MKRMISALILAALLALNLCTGALAAGDYVRITGACHVHDGPGVDCDNIGIIKIGRASCRERV